ncbi:signal peptide peptidase SppA [bacterium]|nr:signal peptide peptidase SppA [bacterium]
MVKLIIGKDYDLFNHSSIAVVDVSGMIIDSTEIIKQLHYSKDNNNIKAVVLRIDSPGGVVGPTQEIYTEIIKLQKIKPVVVSMGSVAASGGYYISAPANIIFANPGTITGSIGVLMKLANFQTLLDKIGIKSFVIKSGEFKDAGSPVRPITAQEKKVMQGIIDNMHNQFVLAVANGRKIPIERVRVFADGRIFTGEQAQQLRLVDQLGNLQDAIDEAAKISGLKQKPRIIYPPKTRKSILDVFIEGASESFLKGITTKSGAIERFEYAVEIEK